MSKPAEKIAFSGDASTMKETSAAAEAANGSSSLLGAIQPELPPLRGEAFGAIRIGQTRVLLELVIQAFQDGTAPETIVQRYSTLSLGDVYAVIAFYLRHKAEVEGYLAWREQKAEEVRQRIEKEQDDLKARFSHRKPYLAFVNKDGPHAAQTGADQTIAT